MSKGWRRIFPVPKIRRKDDLTTDVEGPIESDVGSKSVDVSPIEGSDEPWSYSLQTTCATISQALEVSPPTDDTEAGQLICEVISHENPSPRMGEIIARWHLKHGRIDEALQVSDDYLLEKTASGRLLHDVCLCLAGQRVSAHLDLSDWSRRPECPTAARVLLAVLEMDDERPDRALDALRRNLDQIEDPLSIQMMILIHLERERPEEAAYWIQRLAQTKRAWLENDQHRVRESVVCELAHVDSQAPESPPVELVEQLAIEIQGDENLIPSLVVGQKLEPDDATNRLLSLAIEKAMPELEHPKVVCESLARLALIRQDITAAKQWIHRGLELNPMSVPLAMMLVELPDSPLKSKPDRAASTGVETRDVRVRTHSIPIRRPKQVSLSLASDNVDDVDQDVPESNERFMPWPDQVKLLKAVERANPQWPDLKRIVEQLEAA